MENVIHRLTLDLTGADMMPRVEVQQDNARTLVISLTQGGRPYWITEGVTAVFSARKPDGNPLFNACTIEKNRVRYDFTEQTTNVAGIVECEILLYDSEGKRLASSRFELAIDELIHRDGDVPESAPEISALTQMVAAGTAMIEDLREALAGLDGVEEILTQAQAAAEAASNSEAAAKGHAKTAAKAAEDALTLAGQANSASQQANKYAYEAGQAQAAAVTAAGDAQVQAETAEGYALRAETAAKRAEDAAANLPQGGGDGSGQNPPQDGEDGFSPTVAVSAITGGHRITITDKNGTKTVDVMDGKDGDPGDPGRGIKSITRTSGNGAAGTEDTYTIVYTDGTTSTYQVRNGANGQAATLEITGVTALAAGAAPTITEVSGSTAQNRKYIIGIPAGKTPAAGTDYFTDADKASMVQAVIDALPKYAGEVTYV